MRYLLNIDKLQVKCLRVGVNQWRDSTKPSEILTNFCKHNNLEIENSEESTLSILDCKTNKSYLFDLDTFGND